VEDVSTLCSSFAIICKGEVLYAGDPERAVRELEGAIFSRVIEQPEVGHYRSHYEVISTQLKGGRLHIRVLSRGAALGDGWMPAAPDLEDVYFSVIATRVDLGLYN
jgi:ABC-type multidrug transport system ATPase subunit